MPAPAVYVLAVVGTVAAGVAFYEFVYEPHIAPKIEEWAHNWKAKRAERRRQRANPILVPAKDHQRPGTKQDVELTELASSLTWGTRGDNNSTLRQRRAPGRPAASSILSSLPLEESNITLPYLPMTPTHVISDPSDPEPSSPASTIFSSHKSQSPPPARHNGLPTPETSPARAPVNLLPRIDNTSLQTSAYQSFGSPSLIPSLSLSHPVDLDQEHDVELLSAPSSRADSPFSSISHNSNSELYYSTFSTTPAAGSTSRFQEPEQQLHRVASSDRVSIHSFNSQSSLSLTSFDDSEAEEDASRRSSISEFSLINGDTGSNRN